MNWFQVIVNFPIETIDMTHFAPILLKQLILKFLITETQTNKQTKEQFPRTLLSANPNGVGSPKKKSDHYVNYLWLWACWIPGIWWPFSTTLF